MNENANGLQFKINFLFLFCWSQHDFKLYKNDEMQ